MSDNIDDLLGIPVTAPAPAPAPSPDLRTEREQRRLRAAEQLAKEAAIKAAGRGGTFVEMGVLKRPVSQNFLAEVFDMDPATVRKRLIRCPKLGMAGGQRPVYDFKTACQYLLPPKMTADEFIRTLHHAKLPPEVNKVFWQAQRERLRFMRDAGEVWHTSDVLEVLGQVNMTFKDRLDMLVEDVREMKGISDQHVAKIEEMAHSIRAALHEALVEMPKRGETVSMRDKEDPLAPGDGGDTEFEEGQISDAL